MNTTTLDFEIFPPYEAFYIESMLTRTSSALSSVEVSNKILKTFATSGESDLPQGWRRMLLDEMQNVILQGGALSRYFWPPRDGKKSEHKKRGEFLRKIFSISPGNSLESRSIRNHLEHFDEKLDLYLIQAPVVGIVLPDFVGVSNQVGQVPHHMFRGYFMDLGIFQILNEKFELNPLVEEIARIDDLLLEFNKTGRLTSLKG